MAQITPELLARTRAAFGANLANQMGYAGNELVAALADQLDVTLDRRDVTLRFACCGREMLASIDEEAELSSIGEAFADGIAETSRNTAGEASASPGTVDSGKFWLVAAGDFGRIVSRTCRPHSPPLPGQFIGRPLRDSAFLRPRRA